MCCLPKGQNVGVEGCGGGVEGCGGVWRGCEGGGGGVGRYVEGLGRCKRSTILNGWTGWMTGAAKLHARRKHSNRPHPQLTATGHQ